MTTRVSIAYLNGNKTLEVIDSRDGSVAATLRGPGDVFEQNIHSGAEFAVREGKEVENAGARPGAEPNATAEEASTDAGRFESERLPPGAGDDGSNVPDVHVEGRETDPSASSGTGGSERQGEYDAARTRNSPKNTL